MIGKLISRRQTSTSASSDGHRRPSFPTFLLPSFRIPLPGWRVPEPPSSSSPPPSASAVPSLSSSPTSPTSPPAGPREDPLGGGHRRRRRLSSIPSAAGGAASATLRCRGCSADLAFLAQIVSKAFTGRHGPAYLVSPPPAQATPSCPRWPRNNNTTNRATTATAPTTPDLVNVRVGRPETRRLTTGEHVVADIRCAGCGAAVGWKYLAAADAAQEYKVGKFVLEARRVVGYHQWEDVPVRERERVRVRGGGVEDGDGEAVVPGGVEEEEEEVYGSEQLFFGGGAAGDELDGEEDVVVFDSEDEEECEDMFAGVWDAKEVARRRQSRVYSMSLEHEDSA
ncbi:fac5f008-8744-4c25-8f0d-53d3c876e345 [Thermothielavioides terrestris]|uniref:Yippee domain-containing protein n=2 Tax=Thermothielavioides terrestris TaxID=2587410 RepID=G2QUE0_THETT|nr:uncharacterized protein THITE_2169528 [Thermothielavioides terrestris NRRL 8126]AEO63692.1 hypothetical protein THITE_2169528 [Thermothielavioides terrestris NRRL 8126]SPQ20805.1 fac5f008-8744-4c25-8f0d-53d3c876e345 [Thermothielavioides terrestris]